MGPFEELFSAYLSPLLFGFYFISDQIEGVTEGGGVVGWGGGG